MHFFPNNSIGLLMKQRAKRRRTNDEEEKIFRLFSFSIVLDSSIIVLQYLSKRYPMALMPTVKVIDL